MMVCNRGKVCLSASRNISLRHIRCFLEVATSGSFTVAASRLFVTQSALTLSLIHI